MMITLLTIVAAMIGIVCYMGYNANEHIIECKTNNFYYIYGIVDEDTCILFKKAEDMTETELQALEEYEESNGELEGLFMVDTHVSDEAKKNYMYSSTNIDVYGMQNVYLCEKGIGPFVHQYEKIMDVLYLTDNTAIKLGLKEGELPYDYITMPEEDEGIASGSDATSMEAVESTESMGNLENVSFD